MQGIRRSTTAACIIAAAALACLLLAFPCSDNAEAAADPFTEAGIVYTPNGGNAVVTGYDEASASTVTSITIPASVTHGGVTYSVTAIGSEAFKGFPELASASMDSITGIGQYAFADCPKLTSISVSNVTTIQEGTFQNCTGLQSVYLSDSITSIESKAFENCTALTSVTIPYNVTKIGSRAFENCTSLTTVTFADNAAGTIQSQLKSIRISAFSGCTSLTSIDLPANVTSIGTSAFYNCSSIDTVNILNGSFTDAMVSEDSFELNATIVWVNCPSQNYTGAGFKGVSTVHLNEQKFKVTFVDAGDLTETYYAAGDEITQIPEKSGFQFTGWSPDVTVMPAYDLVLTAQWKTLYYTITFDANGGYGTMASQVYSYTTSADLNANAFGCETGNFSFWSIDGEGTDPVSNTTYLATNDLKDVTVYAIWTDSAYQVTFEANGGNGTMRKEPYDTDESKSLLHSTFYKTGYTFIGWSETSDGAVKYSDEEICTFTVSTTLYAKWEPNTYTITFDLNGASQADPYFQETHVLTYDVPVDISPYKISRTGYTFGYWVNLSSQSVTYTDTLLNVATGGSVTLTAVWNPIPSYLVFEANSEDATGTMSDQTVYYGVATNLTACGFSVHHMDFKGWATTADGEVVYNDEGEIIPDYTTSSYVHLYAVWEDSKYKVVYDPGDAECETVRIDEVLKKEDYTVAGCPYTWEGHEFSYYKVIYADGSTKTYHPGDVISDVPDSRSAIILNVVWDSPETSGDDFPTALVAAAAIVAALAICAVVFIRRR